MKKSLILGITLLAMMSCHHNQNPLLSNEETPYGVPAFDKIRLEHYMPAFKEAIKQQNEEIDAIVNNPEDPTFENTIVPLEFSGSILRKVSGVLYNITETDRTEALDSVMELAIPLTTEHSDNMSFNKALYERIATLYKGDQSKLTREQQMVLKKHFEDFERSGIGLSEEKQARLREINTEMAGKIQKIGNNILAESNAFEM